MTRARTKTVAIDFDGVLHAYGEGWHDGTIYGRPTEGAQQFVEKIMARDDVCAFVLTSRGAGQVARWIDEQFGWSARIACPFSVRKVRPWERFWSEPRVLGVTNRKLPAVAYIDDRAVPFRGSWPEVEGALSKHRFGIGLNVVRAL